MSGFTTFEPSMLISLLMTMLARRCAEESGDNSRVELRTEPITLGLG